MARQFRSMRFEVPFAMAEPILVNRELGIERASQRGRQHNFQMEVTLLDSPDHRLLRSGVVLAHRVLDGLGEWYLDAPGWQPWLPHDRTEALGAAGDLPEEFASLVRPFRRRAPLGPVAAVACQRHDWNLLGAEGARLARLRDDRITIRRGGLTTARYREVTISPLEQGLNREQRAHVVEALLAGGGARVEEFATLVERIGAPATGLTDFPGPERLREIASAPEATFEQFVRWQFAICLDALMRADLALRSGQDDDMDLLREQLAALRLRVRSLAFALEPEWRAELEGDIDAVLAGLASRTVHQLGEEYFAVLDALVSAVRAPRLGNLSHRQASAVLAEQATTGATILLDRARSLTLASGDERWAAALASATQMQALAATTAIVFGKRARKLARALDEIVAGLRACQMPPEAQHSEIDLGWDQVTAFQEGRHFERLRQERFTARRAFIDAWPALETRVRRLRRAG